MDTSRNKAYDKTFQYYCNPLGRTHLSQQDKLHIHCVLKQNGQSYYQTKTNLEIFLQWLGFLVKIQGEININTEVV